MQKRKITNFVKKYGSSAHRRGIEEVWVSPLGRLVSWQVSKSDIAWTVKKALRKDGYQRLGTL